MQSDKDAPKEWWVKRVVGNVITWVTTGYIILLILDKIGF